MASFYRSFVLLTACVAVTTSRAGTVERTAEINGYDRYWVEYVPDGLIDPVAVVFALHPGVSSAADFERTSGWNTVADEYGFIVVYPQVGAEATTRGTWSAWAEVDALTERSDVEYLNFVAESVFSAYDADDSSLFMTGFSSGAQMVNVYALVGDYLPAAIAPVSGGWADAYGVPSEDLPRPDGLPIWIWRGSEEDPITGTPGNKLPRNEQDDLQLAFWLEANASNGIAADTQQVNVDATLSYPFGDLAWSGVHTTSYYPDGDAEVRFTEVTRSNHVYQPGAAERLWEEFFMPLLPTALPGDFNGDGYVDAADYTVWRDGDSPDSSQAGYDVWVNNFGVRATSRSASVPEPSAGLSMFTGCGLTWLGRRTATISRSLRSPRLCRTTSPSPRFDGLQTESQDRAREERSDGEGC